MIRIIDQSTRITAHGSPPKQIEEFVGRLTSDDHAVSIARMVSPTGWSEPAQTAAFTEYTLVLSGHLRVQAPDAVYDVHADQTIIVPAGQTVQYSTPIGATYIAVCCPAFSPQTVRRHA